MLFIIHAVNNTAGNNYFELIGEHQAAFPANAYVQIRNSTGNNGMYRVSGAVNASGYTQVSVFEPIPSGVADGHLNGGVYQIDFSDASISGKNPIILAPSTLNDSALSIALPARGAWDYGERLVENAVHVLENFAASAAPANPTTGQHWFDYATKSLKTYVDGQWTATSNIENGVLTFKDPQNATPNSRMVVTASEPNGMEDTGLTIFPEHDVATGSPVFRILAVDGSELLCVRRNSELFTELRLVSSSTDTNELAGKLAVSGATAFSAGSGLSVTGHIDVAGRVIFDEATSNGLIGTASGSTIQLINGLWTVTSSTVDAVTLNNDSGQVAKFGSVNVLNTPTTLSTTLTVVGTSSLSTTNVTGTMTATNVVATTSMSSPVVIVTGSLEVDGVGTKLLRQFDANGQALVNLIDPTQASDAATKQYVDDNDFISSMGDATITAPTDVQVLQYQASTSKWVNATLDSSSISGFGGSVKDQAAEMIVDGTHVGITSTYDSLSKTLDLTMDSRPVTIDGSVLGSANIDWNGTTTINTTLSTTGVSSGTYSKVTVNAEGRVTAGGSVTPADIAGGNYDLQNTYKVYNAIDPVDAGDYVTLRFLENYTFDAGTF